MKHAAPIQVITSFVLLVLAVALLSVFSTSVWGDKPENRPVFRIETLQMEMTAGQFGKDNQVPGPVLKKVLQLSGRQDLEKKLSSFGISEPELKDKVVRAMALAAEHESKNWFKIPLKFALWLLFLTGIFFLSRRKGLSPTTRKTLYLTAVAVFGVILGSDPSPMGPIKDAIALYGAKGVIFMPRIIALAVFLLLVIVANKFICAWGCQLGVLQDFIFRLNRTTDDTKGVMKQYKPSFLFSNTVRVLFFLTFTTAAFGWALDLVEPIDPFKIYKPAMLSMAGWSFVLVLLTTSLFIYRPWCHFFCPFGLVGWIFEQLSLFRVQVNRETCTECGTCTRVCPSTAMGAIMKNQRLRPDCFACTTCMGACPTKSISLKRRKRSQSTGSASLSACLRSTSTLHRPLPRIWGTLQSFTVWEFSSTPRRLGVHIAA